MVVQNNLFAAALLMRVVELHNNRTSLKVGRMDMNHGRRAETLEFVMKSANGFDGEGKPTKSL